VDAAVSAARRAFEEGAWGRMTAVERGRLMAKLGEAILAHHEELAQLEARDCGKPMKQARADITATARYFEFYGAAPTNSTAKPSRFSTATWSPSCASRRA